MVIGHFEEPHRRRPRRVGRHGRRRGTSTRPTPTNDYKRGFIMVGDARLLAAQHRARRRAPWGEGHHEALEHHLNHEATRLGLRRRRSPRSTTASSSTRSNLDGFGLPGRSDLLHAVARTRSASARTGGARGRRSSAYAAGADSVRTTRVRLHASAGTCSAPPGWAPTRRTRWSTPTTALTTCPNLYVVDGSSFCRLAAPSTRRTRSRRSRSAPPTRSGRRAVPDAPESDAAVSDRLWEVTIVKYGTRQTVRSEVYLNYHALRRARRPDRHGLLLLADPQRGAHDPGGHRLLAAGGASRKRTTLIEPVDALRTPSGVDRQSAPPVVVTHAHYDHAGNLAFPASPVIVRRASTTSGPARTRTGAVAPLGRGRRARPPGDAASRAGCDFAEATRVAPGVGLLEVGGHTPGQSVVLGEHHRGPVCSPPTPCTSTRSSSREHAVHLGRRPGRHVRGVRPPQRLLATGAVATWSPGHDPRPSGASPRRPVALAGLAVHRAGGTGRRRALQESHVSGRFEGKVALVTGAGSGLGRASARRLSAEGAAVVAHRRQRRRREHLAAELPGSHWWWWPMSRTRRRRRPPLPAPSSSAASTCTT